MCAKICATAEKGGDIGGGGGRGEGEGRENHNVSPQWGQTITKERSRTFPV